MQSDAFAGKPDVPEFSTTYWRTVEHFLDLMVNSEVPFRSSFTQY